MMVFVGVAQSGQDIQKQGGERSGGKRPLDNPTPASSGDQM